MTDKTHKTWRFFDSLAVLPLLVVMYPLVFTTAANWFYYTPLQNWVAFLFMFGMGAAGSLVVYFLEKAGNVLAEKGHTGANTVLRVAITAICLFVFMCLFHEQVRGIFSVRTHQFIAYAVVIAAGCTIVLLRRVAVLNFFLSLLLVFSTVSLVSSVLGEKDAISLELTEENAFVDHPDIFILFLESYHSLAMQREVYDRKDNPLGDYLKNNEFSIYNGYSNYMPTMPSAEALFGMRHHYYLQLRGKNDAAQCVRQMLGGDSTNLAARILKENGYHISLVDLSRYLIREQGPLVDSSNIKNPSRFGAEWLFTALRPVGDMHYRLDEALRAILRPHKNEFSDSAEALRSFIQSTPAGTPGFYFVKEGADHSKSWQEREEWKEEYRNLLDESDKRVIELLETIRELRPDAVVLLVGDHGALGSVNLWNETGPQSFGEVAGLAPDEVARDSLDVLFAGKWPGDDPFEGVFLSHVNYMRRLFAALSHRVEDAYLPDDGFIYSPTDRVLYRVMQDGELLEEWQDTTELRGKAASEGR